MCRIPPGARDSERLQSLDIVAVTAAIIEDRITVFEYLVADQALCWQREFNAPNGRFVALDGTIHCDLDVTIDGCV